VKRNSSFAWFYFMTLPEKIASFRFHFVRALQGKEEHFTSGSINKALFYLAIPMMLEMVMESLFAVVDIFFVGKIGVDAVAAVGLTESVVTVIYSVSIGLSMAATAVVARRVGEQKYRAAADAAFQAILLATSISILTGLAGVFYAEEALLLMGANTEVIASGVGYTRIIFVGNVGIMLLFLINGIFRGAGSAAIAMKTLWIANGINIVLDPILIFGLGFIPALGIEGAAWATTIGRCTGVLYQLWHLLDGSAIIRITRKNLTFRFRTIVKLLKLSVGGMGQFLIESACWIVLMRIVSESGSIALAGYTIAIRIIIFTILPAWGLANAASTLVGQNLGAGHPERAEKSVWKAAFYNAVFLGLVSLVFILLSDSLISIFHPDKAVREVGSEALMVVCLGYVFFAYGMVVSQSFNGAGDTFTPTLINIGLFWLLEIPLAWFFGVYFNWGASGVFWAIAIAHSLHAVVSVALFRMGRWKKTKV
jgi:putative MATE family efflux protein